MRRALVLLVLALAAAACGIPTDGTPRALPAEGVPNGLLELPTTSTSTTLPPLESASVNVFLLTADRLSPVERSVPADVQLVAVIEALLSGARPEEQEQGLSSAIPPTAELLDAQRRPAERLALVDLSSDFNVEGAQLRRAVAQVVYTATALPDVERVTLLIEGREVEVPVEDGSLVRRPLTRRDFPTLDPDYVPPPTTSSTTTTAPPPDPGPGEAPG